MLYKHMSIEAKKLQKKCKKQVTKSCEKYWKSRIIQIKISFTNNFLYFLYIV